MWTGEEVKVAFDFAHLAESILAETRDHVSMTSSSTSLSTQVSASRTCPLGGDAHTPLLTPDELMAKRPGRRAR